MYTSCLLEVAAPAASSCSRQLLTGASLDCAVFHPLQGLRDPNQIVLVIRMALMETSDVSAPAVMPKSKEDARKTRNMDFVTKSCGCMSEELNTSVCTISPTIREDFKCRSYRRQTGQILIEASKGKRVLKQTRLLIKLDY